MPTNKHMTPAEDIHLCMVIARDSHQHGLGLTSQTVRLKTSELQQLRATYGNEIRVIVLKTIKPKRAATYGEEAC